MLFSKSNWFLFFFLLCGTIMVAQDKIELGGDEELVKESTELDSSTVLDGVVERTIVQDNRVLAYEPMREADIPWEKKVWRVIDVAEKMNLPFVYPNRPFFQILSDLALNGDITVYKKDDFKAPMTVEEVQATMSTIDTIIIYNEETYEETVKIVHNDINYEDIKKYRVKEIWFFDEESSRMLVRVLGIAPIKDFYDQETGDFKYALPLFWAYFPEARNYLAKELIFVAQNDVAPMTWQDLFEARYFSSYIYKITNPLDMRIKDYIKSPLDDPLQEGIDRLLESRRIKNYLFNMEQDLWSY